MAFISPSGIVALNPIKSEHILRIINALNGTLSNDVTVSGSTKLKTLYAPSMVGPTSFTGTFTATHTVNNIDTFAIVGQNTTNAGSGIYGYSANGKGIYVGSDSGTGLYAYSNSGPIARFATNKDYQLIKIFNNGNLLLNPLTASSEYLYSRKYNNNRLLSSNRISYCAQHTNTYTYKLITNRTTNRILYSIRFRCKL